MKLKTCGCEPGDMEVCMKCNPKKFKEIGKKYDDFMKVKIDCYIEYFYNKAWLSYCNPMVGTSKEHTDYLNNLRKKNPNTKYRLVQVVVKHKILKY